MSRDQAATIRAAAIALIAATMPAIESHASDLAAAEAEERRAQTALDQAKTAADSAAAVVGEIKTAADGLTAKLVALQLAQDQAEDADRKLLAAEALLANQIPADDERAAQLQAEAAALLDLARAVAMPPQPVADPELPPVPAMPPAAEPTPEPAPPETPPAEG